MHDDISNDLVSFTDYFSLYRVSSGNAASLINLTDPNNNIAYGT